MEKRGNLQGSGVLYVPCRHDFADFSFSSFRHCSPAKHCFLWCKTFFLLGGNIAFFGEGRTEAVGASSFAQLKDPV
ncbi:MAG TPA: hypothetical protein H9807_02630 [Candidatus Bacteroides merdavium]|uniref:Uncharacterized protein n=1 Tax=Candidatus Bacteroides merdavium TaxID=2838472 RepID=A0A9D2KC12_9BACE|nr:hypothetical protein [Candidatus Bacteroides merdavium]